MAASCRRFLPFPTIGISLKIVLPKPGHIASNVIAFTLSPALDMFLPFPRKKFLGLVRQRGLPDVVLVDFPQRL